MLVKMYEFDLLQSKPNIEPKLFYPTKQVNNKDTIKLIMEPSACNCAQKILIKL